MLRVYLILRLMIYYLCAVEWIRGSISGRNNDSPRIVLSRDLRVPFLLSCPSSRRAISNETDLTTRRGGRLVASWPSILNRSSESRIKRKFLNFDRSRMMVEESIKIIPIFAENTVVRDFFFFDRAYFSLPPQKRGTKRGERRGGWK